MSSLRGDETALYEQHARRLEQVVRARVRCVDRTLVEDACSFAWMQLIRCQPDRETAFPWLVQVATREAWRLNSRNRLVSPAGTATPETGHPGPAPDLDEQVAFRDLLSTVATFPERRRTCLAMLIAGHSYTEISDATGFTVNALNKQLVKARRTLRDHGHDLH